MDLVFPSNTDDRNSSNPEESPTPYSIITTTLDTQSHERKRERSNTKSRDASPNTQLSQAPPIKRTKASARIKHSTTHPAYGKLLRHKEGIETGEKSGVAELVNSAMLILKEEILRIQEIILKSQARILNIKETILKVML